MYYVFSPKRFIDKMIEGYKTLFGNKPKKNVTSALEKGDHPELDDLKLLDEEGISKYQSLIGSLQWAISLKRFDIMTAVMTMSSFRAAPRKGHKGKKDILIHCQDETCNHYS